MRNFQVRRMEGQPGSVALVGKRRTVKRAVVDAFAADRRAGFAEVNADLMRAPRFQPAFHQGKIAEAFHDGYMSDRAFAVGGFGDTAATPVASVVPNEGLDAIRLGSAAHDGQVTTADRVGAKLP